jgi:D-threo-aldose 1-dehydrogenase
MDAHPEEKDSLEHSTIRGTAMLKNEERKPFGATGLLIPPIVFGTSAIGNLYRQMSPACALKIVEQWFKHLPTPVAIDSAGKYGAGLALERIGSALAELGVKPEAVVVSNKLGWRRVPLTESEPTFEPGIWAGLEHDAVQTISRDGVVDCWREGNALLGHGYRTALVSVHDPDEYLAAARDNDERRARYDHLLEAYQALGELKARGSADAVGVGAKDWRVIWELSHDVSFDWVMFAGSYTIYTHPPELMVFFSQLAERGVGIINSAVFNSGFLTGGRFFDYREPDPVHSRELYEWRQRYFGVCDRHGINPAEACVEFALSHPAVSSVALNTSRPERVRKNVETVQKQAPAAFWIEMKEARLLDPDYPYLG